MKTINLFSRDMPLIANLGNGVYLVAHENGPAVSNGEYIGHIASCKDERIKERAIRAYVDWSWPATEQLRGC